MSRPRWSSAQICRAYAVAARWAACERASDNVLERFELLYIVSTSYEEVQVDPYSGAIHKRIDRSGDCMERSYR